MDKNITGKVVSYVKMDGDVWTLVSFLIILLQKELHHCHFTLYWDSNCT